MNITKEGEDTVKEKVIFIPGSVPSLKNSKIKTSRGVFMSKTCLKYLRSLNIQGYSASKKTVKGYVDTKSKPNLFLKALKPLLKEFSTAKSPIMIGFHFVRGTKAKFDFNNANQIILDLLTAHNILEDDNMDYCLPLPYYRDGRWFSVDKDNPGVYIKIYKENDVLCK